ncbi:hydroxymethylbilane synthase [soil metagenome]
MTALRIGTRGSALALWQARAVGDALQRAGVRFELVIITTHGDIRLDAPLSSIGGKGVFVTEIHDALLRGEIDLAVHSAKDMAAVSPGGLMIAAVLPREDPRDAWILPAWRADSPDCTSGFADEAAIGTGSPRRIAQLRRYHPRARFESIRGNVDTRLRKLDAGGVDALVLACAGLRRLGLGERISRPIPVDECVPAPGQGIIAIEVRAGDAQTGAPVAALNDPRAFTALAAEQAVVAALGGGCQLPLGVLAEVEAGEIRLRAVAASFDGSRIVSAHATGHPGEAVETGRRLARDLASRGAMELLHS